MSLTDCACIVLQRCSCSQDSGWRRQEPPQRRGPPNAPRVTAGSHPLYSQVPSAYRGCYTALTLLLWSTGWLGSRGAFWLARFSKCAKPERFLLPAEVHRTLRSGLGHLGLGTFFCWRFRGCLLFLHVLREGAGRAAAHSVFGLVTLGGHDFHAQAVAGLLGKALHCQLGFLPGQVFGRRSPFSLCFLRVQFRSRFYGFGAS